jgi:CD109 antigen
VLSQPREQIEFNLQSKPDSTVFLLAIDQSLNLLKTGNDIDVKTVFDNLNAYNAHKNYKKLEISGSFSDDSRYIGADEYNSFLITNAYKGEVVCLNERGGTEMVPAEDDEIELDETNDFSDFESKERYEFPETWIFGNMAVDSRGQGKYESDLPDTITTWDITAFSLSKDHGLGIAKPQSLTVAQKFFLMVHLPYSIRIGEILRVDVTVFNYFPKAKSISVDVTLYSHSDETVEEEDEIGMNYDTDEIQNEFDFYDASKEQNRCKYSKLEAESSQGLQMKRITVDKGTGGATFFYIQATKAGNRKIKVRAQVTNQKPFDLVEKSLLVEYDGIRTELNFPYMVDLRLKDHDSYHASVSIPEEDVIKSSIKIKTSVLGDLIGPALVDTEKLM